ncbi:hypothetical protein AAG906_027517 [Vitis piasezkii]
MLDWCFGARRVRQMQRAFRHGKITLMCLLMTVVVLRGTIGAGKFGTPEQDFNEIREHFHNRKRVEPHRVLEEAEVSTESSESNNYATFDISKLTVDEGEDEKPDPNKPYSLGPKISDWDEQRAEWLRKNPNFPNFIGPNKPRVLLVTGSSPKPCENPVGDHYLLKAIKNKIDYCRLHGIEIFYNMALLDAEMAGFWAKLPLIRKLLLSHPEIEFLWWMDSDAMFTDMAFEVPWERYKDHNFVMHGWNEMVYDQKNWIGLNTGSFLLRNCQWALDILDAWAPMGPKGKIRTEAGKILTRELKDRPVFEADDQSAMVYLLATQRDNWGDKVYLESAYYLHGYWGILVDRYEEMIENHHPGLGDHRWPLVTHFVGCKPCGKFGDYPVERCLKQMDRAFNFGDNQILQIYGFTHKSLASRRVKRTRNDTSNPLEVKDDLGLLHPAFKAVKLYHLKFVHIRDIDVKLKRCLTRLVPILNHIYKHSLRHVRPLHFDKDWFSVLKRLYNFNTAANKHDLVHAENSSFFIHSLKEAATKYMNKSSPLHAERLQAPMLHQTNMIWIRLFSALASHLWILMPFAPFLSPLSHLFYCMKMDSFGSSCCSQLQL